MSWSHRFGTLASGGPRPSWAGKVLPASGPRELRASLAGARGDEMLEVRDGRVLPAVLQEFDDGLDLRAHAPRRELAVREVLLRLGDRHPIEELLARLAEIQGHLGDIRRDHGALPSDGLPEPGRRMVLVNDGLDADELA